MSHSLSLLLSPKFTTKIPHHVSQLRLPSFNPLLSSYIPISSLNSPKKRFFTDYSSRKFNGYCLKAAKNEEIKPEESSKAKNDAVEARGMSTLPDRFRGLTKEAPDKPLRWPWLVALGFAVYTCRAVLWELANWKTAAIAVFSGIVYLLKLILGLLYQIIGPPITAILWCFDFVLNFTISVYSSVVSATPVPELLVIIILSAAVAAVANVASPGSVNSQQHFLTAAGLVGYMAVGGAVNGLVFFLLIALSISISMFLLKKDAVSAALPAAALLVSVGEPWLRVLTLTAFFGLAVVLKSTSSADVDDASRTMVGASPPVPLQLAALAIGVHVAAKWLRYRHLTWMIV